MNWRVGWCGWVKTTHFFVQHTDMMNDFSEQNSYDTLQSHFSPSSSCTSCSFRIRQLCTHISTFHRSTFITDEGTQEARIIRVINVLMKFHLDERNFSRLYIFITFATILDSNITPVSKRVWTVKWKNKEGKHCRCAEFMFHPIILQWEALHYHLLFISISALEMKQNEIGSHWGNKTELYVLRYETSQKLFIS